ncbi:MAG TPA: putative 2OG-Fe(II) oxygenase [Sphingomicrobium sp.]|nr:putative 2OG-Fe(II) oxygenase [Sphingomicrobium sp.]
MSAPPLPAEIDASFRAAQRLLAAGRPGEAAEQVAPHLAAGLRHPDLLLLYAVACERQGRIGEAVGAAEAARVAEPGRAESWAIVGRLLHRQGRSVEATAMLQRAVELEPGNCEYWHNLGIFESAAGDLDRAANALVKATELTPDWAMAWGALGHVRQLQGWLEEAESCLRKAIDLDPELASPRHNLAVVLRRLDRPAEALELLDALPKPAAESRLVAAHLLVDLDRPEEAVDQYRYLLRDRPDMIAGHETLARLLPQLGRGEEALDSYRQALAAQPSLDLYRSAMGSARDLKDHQMMIEWAEASERQFGPSPETTAFRGLGLGMAGDVEDALRLLEPLAESGFHQVSAHCAYYRLKLRDLDLAETHALAAVAADPTDQPAWAYLTIIWRLKSDPREAWLADYQRLVMPIDITPPEGFADSRTFMAALATELTRLHLTSEAPAEQSLRQGTQTRGNLFERRVPLVRALAGQIERQLSDRLATLPPDPLHPFLARNSGRVRFVGSWSVRLRSGGFHIHHIHQQGWLSSALYIALPPGVGESKGASPGSLLFGVPDSELGLDLPPRRIEAPRVGRLVVFPSYFWHGTVPFESDQPRLSVAFDAQPA